MNVSKHPLYGTWRSIISRCSNPNVHNFHNYGGRGVTVCQRWRSSFESFVADVGDKPSPEYTLDRRDPNGDYEPGNCQWATKTHQARNQRRTTTVTIDGVTYTAPDLAEMHGRPVSTIIKRIKRGLNTIAAISAPPWSMPPAYGPWHTDKRVALLAHIRSRTNCKRGHELTDQTSFIDRNGSRVCRTCVNDARRIARRAAKDG